MAMTAVDVRLTWLTHGSPALNIQPSEDKMTEPHVEDVLESALPQVIEEANAYHETASGEDSIPKNHQTEYAMASMNASSHQASDRRLKQAEERKQTKLPPFSRAAFSYIEITSPAGLEALRSVVDYYPEYDLQTKRLKIYWPYSILTHVRDALTRYRDLFPPRKLQRN